MENLDDTSIQAPGVLDRYKAAGVIAQTVMQELLEKCVEGKDIRELCLFGNQRISEEVKKVYSSKKNMEKGVAFPVCISVNEIAGHFSPQEKDSYCLVKNDLVKVNLGVHVDGYPVVIAHSKIVGGENDKLLECAYNTLVNTVKFLRKGYNNQDLSIYIKKMVESYGFSPVEGVLSHEVGRYVLDGRKCFQMALDQDKSVDKFDFEPNQVFVVDILVSENPESGKCKVSETDCTVFRRDIDQQHTVKLKESVKLLKETDKRFCDFCFSLNDFEKPSEVRIGLSECLKTHMFQKYQVIEEKSKSRVAQFKWTVAISGKRLLFLSGLRNAGLEEKVMKVDDEKLDPIFEQKLDDFTNKKKKKKKKN